MASTAAAATVSGDCVVRTMLGSQTLLRSGSRQLVQKRGMAGAFPARMAARKNKFMATASTNHLVAMTTAEWDYSIEDAQDDTGVDDNNVVVSEEEIWQYIDNIPQESLGFGWFDKEMATLSNSVDLSLSKFSTKPRPYDKRPSSVPAQHPIRAIARVLQEAPRNSTVRIYCYALSDPFALDLLIHHGGDKTVKIIMQPCERSKNRIKEMLKRFEKVNSYDVFYARVQIRIANLNSPACTRYTSMHDKRLMTEQHCLYGSYNLTPVARCANWEAITLTNTLQREIEEFEAEWSNLLGRAMEEVFPDFYPETFTVPKRRRVN